MTQEDLQRDVGMLESLAESRTMDSSDEDYVAALEAALDRVIETARVLASMSDAQRAGIAEHCDDMATECTSAAETSCQRESDDYLAIADAHRKVARLIGGPR